MLFSKVDCLLDFIKNDPEDKKTGVGSWICCKPNFLYANKHKLFTLSLYRLPYTDTTHF